MTDHAVTTRNLVARAWHAGSDHAAESPFGGPLCNCGQVAGRIIPMLAEAWAAGYEDCFDFYARGNTPPRTRNPYGPEDRHVDQ